MYGPTRTGPMNYLVSSLTRLPPRPSPLEALADVPATVYGLEPVWGAVFAWFLLAVKDGTRAAWIGAAHVLCKLVLLFLVLCIFH
jgi:hypothetical protein